MRISSIKIKDFRCFSDFTISFADEHNAHVILAENMAGKSAIMKALCIAASTFTSGLGERNYGIIREEHRVIGKNPISDRTLSSSIETCAILYDYLGEEKRCKWKKYKLGLTKDRTRTQIEDNTQDPSRLAIDIYLHATSGQQRAILPLLNFIGTEYIHLKLSETYTLTINGNAIQGYWSCFEDKSIQKFLFGWLHKIDGIILEKLSKKVISEAYGDLPNNALEVFKIAVKSILSDIKEIEWSRDKKQPLIQFKNGDVRFFDMLSDGYRYLILLAGELATRAFLLNKHLKTDVLKLIPGIVIIDEFGIHLHPSLQSEALLRLQNTFPKVQFIISTHSPLLVNGLKKEQIHILDADSDGNRTITHPDEDAIGLGAEGILMKMFGLSSTYDRISLGWKDEYKHLLNKKIAQGLTEDEKKRFIELSKLLAPYRLDPSLKIKAEDRVTSIVRERLSEQVKKNTSGKEIPDSEIDLEINKILNDIFNTE